MVWLFERNDEVVKIETRYDSSAEAYVLRLVWADGRESTEQYADASAFDARTLALERELMESRWVQQGGPRLQADGWRGV